jgi:AcrR family transcriptional regulator
MKEADVALIHTPASERLYDSPLLINKPKQARSNQRVAALLDAAAAVVQRQGYENLTTADVAQQAGASIGTVYRYFKDRVAVLEALATRNFERTDLQLRKALDGNHADAKSAIASLFDMYLELFRKETGYRSIRLGDVLDIRPHDKAPWSRHAAHTVVNVLHEKFGCENDDAAITRLEQGFVLVDAMLARAFWDTDKGDQAFIDAARQVAEYVANDFR